MRLAVLSNRRSTRNRGGLDAVRSALAEAPNIPHLELEDWSRFPELVAELARLAPDAVIVNAGDGTVVALMSALRNEGSFARAPDLILLSGGNTSMIAGDVGMPGPPGPALRAVLRAMRSGQPLASATRHLIRLDREGEQSRYGMFFGAIAIVRAIALAREKVHRMGLNHGLANAVALALGALRVIAGGEHSGKGLLAGAPVEIGCDCPAPLRGEFSLVMATTLDCLLFRTRPFWGEERGPIRLTAIRAPVDRPLLSLRPLLRGRPTARMLAKGYISCSSTSLSLRFAGPYMLDGESYRAEPQRPILLSDGGTMRFLTVHGPAG